jgi:hypothetical protein
VLLPKTDKYKENIAKIQGKEPVSIEILNKEENRRDKECEKAIKDAVNVEPPSYPYIENIPYINYTEGSLALMWDKKVKPKYDQKNNDFWIGPYVINKKS